MSRQFAIGIENHLLTATVLSFTSQAVAAPAANLLNAFSWSKWQGTTAGGDTVTFDLGSAKSADYFAVADVNWPTFTGSINIDSSSDNATWTNLGAISPQVSFNVAPYFEPFPRAVGITLASVVSARYWRVRTVTAGSGADIASIGVVAIGQWVIPVIGEHVGVSPPRNNRNVDTYNALSDTGNFLGRSVVDKGTRLMMNLEYLDPSWVNTVGMRLIRVLEIRPIFIAYPPILNSDGAVQVNYMHTEGDIDPPVNTKPTVMKMSFKLRGIR